MTLCITPDTGFPDFLDEFGHLREIQRARERFVWLTASALFPSGGGLAVAYPMLIVAAVDFEYICACRTAEAFGDEETKLKNEEQRQKWFAALNRRTPEKSTTPQSEAAEQNDLAGEKEKAISILLAKIPADVLFDVHRLASQESQHPSDDFSLGLGVRNILRQEGTRLGDVELDDHWQDLLVEAARRAATLGKFSKIGRSSPPKTEEEYAVLEAIVHFEVEQGTQARVNPYRFQEDTEEAIRRARIKVPDEAPNPIVCFVALKHNRQPNDPPPEFMRLFTGEQSTIRHASRSIEQKDRTITDRETGEVGMLLCLDPELKWINDESVRATAKLSIKPIASHAETFVFAYLLTKRNHRWLVDERSVVCTIC